VQPSPCLLLVQAEASQSQISELKAQARALRENCSDLTTRLDGESALASARYTRVRELEEELLRQMQATRGSPASHRGEGAGESEAGGLRLR